MMHDGHALAFGVGNLVISPLEIDGVVVVDSPGSAQGKMEIEQGGWGARPHRSGAREYGVLPHPCGNLSDGTVGLVVLATDVHLEDLVGLLP